MKPLKNHIPNALTCCNLLCGCLAIIFATNLYYFNGNIKMSFLMIGLAAVFDFFDGFAARLLKAPSEIGRELDSLSDLVSFGIAPAIVLISILNSTFPFGIHLYWLILIVPVCGALRLARFNVADAGKTTFRGLPIPACAIFLIGLADWLSKHTTDIDYVNGMKFIHYDDVTYMIAIAVIVLIALAMVSNIPMFSLKFKNYSLRDNFRRYVIIIAAIAFFVLYGVEGLMWTILLYILISLFTRRQTVAA